MPRSKWGQHYRSFKRGARVVGNTAKEIRSFIRRVDGHVSSLGLPDTLGGETGKVRVRSTRAYERDVRRSDLREARALLQRERDRAISKMYRMAVSPDGADIRGTKLDPIGKSSIGRVTLKNAKAELERLSEFNNSSSVWYFSDRNGNPISSRDMRRYYDVVRRYNKDVEDYERSVAGTYLPYMGDATVGDWIRDFRPKRTYLEGGAGYALEPLNENKRPSSFESAEGLRMKTKALEGRLVRNYRKAILPQIKKQIASMLDAIGMPELYDTLIEIPDDVLFLMWTVNDHFANQLSTLYILSKEGYFAKKEAGMDIWYDDAEDAYDELTSLMGEFKNIQIQPEDERDFYTTTPSGKRRKIWR